MRKLSNIFLFPLIACDPELQSTGVLEGNYPAWVDFSEPTKKKNDEDGAIIKALENLIDSTPSGGSIRGVIFSFDLQEIATALVKARMRKVDVRLILDKEANLKEIDCPDVPDSYSPEDLQMYVPLSCQGSETKKTTTFEQGIPIEKRKYCPGSHPDTLGGCIAKHPEGFTHAKFFTFSEADTPTHQLLENVVWFGSANLTSKTGLQKYNNAVTIFSDKVLFDKFNEYFDALWAGNRTDDFYKSDDFQSDEPAQGKWIRPAVRVHVSPEKTIDFVLEVLKQIKPGPCTIRVANSRIAKSRLPVVQKLAQLAGGAHNCRIRVVGSCIQGEPWKKLHDAHNEGADIKIKRNEKIHDKIILVEADFEDGPKKIVLTGSQNLTGRAQDGQDEIFVEMDNAEIYEAYVAHFNNAFKAGKEIKKAKKACLDEADE